MQHFNGTLWACKQTADQHQQQWPWTWRAQGDDGTRFLETIRVSPTSEFDLFCPLKDQQATPQLQRMETPPNPTPDDLRIAKELRARMRAAPQNEVIQGLLNAALAGEAHFRGQGMSLVRFYTGVLYFFRTNYSFDNIRRSQPTKECQASQLLRPSCGVLRSPDAWIHCLQGSTGAWRWNTARSCGLYSIVFACSPWRYTIWGRSSLPWQKLTLGIHTWTSASSHQAYLRL